MARNRVLFYELFAPPVKKFAKKRQTARDFQLKGGPLWWEFRRGAVLEKKQPLVFCLSRRYNGENTAPAEKEEYLMRNVVVNAIGEQCPIPVVKATRALREMTGPGTLEVHVDNEIAVQNLTRMAAGHRLSARSEKRGEKEFVVVMEVTAPVGTVPAGEPACIPDKRGGFVVAVDTDAMGRGSDELGRTLMKGFLFAVSQLPQLPKAILFYNGGARLTVEGSDSLEDLKNMEAQGVEIMTCGTCLNYYGLTEKLAVGGVTNMYSIVEKLAGADKVVKP